ncbi:MAG: hypothetical protein IJJ23_07730 [Clostridia bacterium]|nr:hypothetical protein [Clostridia bacterium]
MKRFLPFFLAVLMLLSVGKAAGSTVKASSADKIVGIDVPFEDIEDFYYTYDASTAPPRFQRYRFYVEDGKRYFYHETREGGGWPQTEEDVTCSGTAELTDDQWAAFCDLLSGGVASERDETIVDGDAGPWLFIYWRGGEEDGREFSFEEPGTMLAFEAFCVELKEKQTGGALSK